MPRKSTTPSWLKDAQAKSLYRRLCDRVTPDAIESLALLCDCWANFLAARRTLDKYGLVVETSTGNLRKNPAYDICKTSLENFCRIAKLLGLYDEVEEQAGSALDELKRW